MRTSIPNLTLGSLLLIFFLSTTHISAHAQDASHFRSQQSPHSVVKTVEMLQSSIQEKGLQIFSTINHDIQAKDAGLELRETRVIIFGNPKAGTLLMQCDPRIGAMLPLKLLIWEDKSGVTQIGYLKPAFYTKNFKLDGEKCQAVVQKMKGLLNGLVKDVIDN